MNLHSLPLRTVLEKHLADARQRLIQTGTRNRLVHSARFAKQGKSIDVVDERSDDVFRMLLVDGRRMRFLHDPSVKESPGGEDGAPLLAASAHEFDESRYVDRSLQTRLDRRAHV